MMVKVIELPGASLLRDGQIALFFGAGISQDPPAGLPDWHDLRDLTIADQWLTAQNTTHDPGCESYQAWTIQRNPCTDANGKNGHAYRSTTQPSARNSVFRRGMSQCPPMSQPIDQSWRSIVEYSEVPTKDDLYIVGSFARSVTVYSQQVRAIGLVDALAGLGRLRQSSRVAVIGGGIAGITAAAALCKIGIRPVIFEKESELAQLQRTSGRRYLHPHIYDWPITSIEDADAKLPVMNWTAKMASEVVEDLDVQWKEISTGRVTIRARSTI